MIIAALFKITKTWKQPNCASTEELVKKLWYRNAHNIMYSAIEKKKVLQFVTTWMNLESIMLSEISQMVRDKYHMISPLTGT